MVTVSTCAGPGPLEMTPRSSDSSVSVHEHSLIQPHKHMTTQSVNQSLAHRLHGSRSQRVQEVANLPDRTDDELL
jgi:hypothetical protein